MENGIWKQASHIVNATACMEGKPPAQHKGTFGAPATFLSSLGWFHKVFLFSFFRCAVWLELWPPSRLFNHPWLPAAVPQRTLSHNQRQPDHICWEDSYGKEKSSFFSCLKLFYSSAAWSSSQGLCSAFPVSPLGCAQIEEVGASSW